jgi:hypothetical protein
MNPGHRIVCGAAVKPIWSHGSHDGNGSFAIARAPASGKVISLTNVLSAAAHLARIFIRTTQTGVNGVPIFRARFRQLATLRLNLAAGRKGYRQPRLLQQVVSTLLRTIHRYATACRSAGHLQTFLVTENKTQIGNEQFRDWNNLFLWFMSGTRHIAAGYPSDLPNRTSTGIPKKTDRYWSGLGNWSQRPSRSSNQKQSWRFVMPPRKQSTRVRERPQSATPIYDDTGLLKLNEEVAEYLREAKHREADELISTVVDAVARNYFRHVLRRQARLRRRTRA